MGVCFFGVLAGNQLYERKKTGKGAAAVHKVLSKKSIDVKKTLTFSTLNSIDMKTKVIQHV